MKHLKKVMIINLLVLISFLGNSQSNHHLGLTFTPYFYGDWNSINLDFNYQGWKFGTEYNYEINDWSNAILGIVFQQSNFDATDAYRKQDGSLAYNNVTQIFYEFKFLTHYSLHKNNWIAKIGANHLWYRPYGRETFNGDRGEIQRLNNASTYIPELHFALGRDFQLQKVQLRTSVYTDISRYKKQYTNYGIDFSILYPLK